MGGGRLPYLLYGTLIAVIVMILMPNSGSFGFGYASLAALSFGALMIALLDVSSNMAMQPFKMMVGDMVNEEQKSYAYGIQSFLANTDAVVAAILPFVFAYIGLANTAEKGVVPQTVVVAFYVGAALLIIKCVHNLQSQRIRPGNLRPLPRHRCRRESGKSQLVRTLKNRA